MKILWIIKHFPPRTGGAQNYNYNTIINIKKFNIVVVTKTIKNSSSERIKKELENKGHKLMRKNIFPDNKDLYI